MVEQQVTAEWSEHDSAIWHTCDIASQVLAGRIAERPPIASPFPPQLASNELLLAHGGFDLSTYRGIGDGKYEHAGGQVFASGRGGFALTAGVAVGRALTNGRRRAAAEADAVPRWVVDDRGSLWVSTAGFYLQTARGLYPWPWTSVRVMTLTAPTAVHVQGVSENGEASWLIRSLWAELVFVLWAMTVHPAHPNLRGGGWLPPGWSARLWQQRSDGEGVDVRPDGGHGLSR